MRPYFTPKKKGFYEALWEVGVHLTRFGRRLGVPSSVQHIVDSLAFKAFPPYTQEVYVALPFEFKLYFPPAFPQARTYACGLYEPEVSSLLLKTLGKGMNFVDVGAFIGYYTLLASRCVGSSGRVWAFEASPLNCAYLLRNVEANRCNNVEVVNKAVSNANGTFYLVCAKEADHNWLSLNHPLGERFMRVESTTLDEFFASAGWPHIDLIKIDIEGGEKQALEGMRELNKRNPRLQLIMEFDPIFLKRAASKPMELISLLQDLGFCRGFIIERGLKPFALSKALPNSSAAYNLLLLKD